VSAKQKRVIRRDFLKRAKIESSKLTNIGQIDAALCALTAHQFALRNFRPYGCAKNGFIVVPGRQLAGLECVSRDSRGWLWRYSTDIVAVVAVWRPTLKTL